MNPLETFLKEYISSHGPMGVDQFMHTALLHQEYGYYTTHEPFGSAGDFVTSPEISQTFGELVGAWCAAMWIEMGKPDTIALVELGPGRGTLMKDALRGTAHITGFHEALHVHLIEASQKLRTVQAGTLSSIHPEIIWHDSFSDIPDVPCLVIANEFFDALPIKQYLFHNNQWFERKVGLTETKELCFVADNPMPSSQHFPNQANEGDILEISPASQVVMEKITSHIKSYGGAGVFIDYGYRDTDYKETIQAVKNHQYHGIFSDIGEADITAHVDFGNLRNIANKTGLSTSKIIPQGEFLARMGIKERYEALSISVNSQEEADTLFSAINRLVDPSHMGELFKVLMVWQDDIRNPI